MPLQSKFQFIENSGKVSHYKTVKVLGSVSKILKYFICEIPFVAFLSFFFLLLLLIFFNLLEYNAVDVFILFFCCPHRALLEFALKSKIKKTR